jgi:hypothetical protein
MPESDTDLPSSPRKSRSAKPKSPSKQRAKRKRPSASSDEQHDSVTPSRTRTRRSGQHPTPAEKQEIKAKFIAAFASSANVLRAAQAAGIPTQTAYEWQKVDTQFAENWENAERDATSLLYEEARRRAYEGVIKPVVSGGRLVYEEIPLIGADGEPVTDKYGKPVTIHGEPLFIREYSDTLMKMLLVAHDPKKFSERQRLEVTGKDGGPIQQQTTVSFTELQALANTIPSKIDDWRKQRQLPTRVERDALTG